MVNTSTDFQRARRPEQVEARRQVILETARAMLHEQPVAEISLRELSSRVGLARSNVLRYFDSREAIFLEIMDETWKSWLGTVEDRLGEPGPPDGPFGAETRVAEVIAGTIAEQRLLCELISLMAGELEKNISLEYARSFKRRASANSARLAALVRAQLPYLTDAAAQHFAGSVFVVVAGLWPYTTPTETVLTVIREMGLPHPGDVFAGNLREGLSNQLVGLAVRAGRQPG
ncbi:TetR/AcrR family transcriptional regulator [Acrocarpospora phusangensis]|uniref:TetR/AcrR family transcriptional regulator n=1 Tax=Acrocarpospora phusangensis TaxID=1070424 RepID=UPI00194FC4B8|nr:TetR family transcriptional regulator [Acrocarpospora phusangensis]